MSGDFFTSSTTEPVLFIKKDFVPGPSFRSFPWFEKNSNKNNNNNPNSISIDNSGTSDNNNKRKTLGNNSYSYILSASINDHYENNNFLMLGTNQTVFVSNSLDYHFSNSSQLLFSSSASLLPSSASSSMTSGTSAMMLIPTLIGIILFTITVWTIFGNILVILAFALDKQIRQGGISNYLIINLAISDLLLGVAVLPFSASYSTFGIWYFGKFLCEFWLAIDVLCSTASIWGLLMIAFDRYIATNYPIRYRHHRHSIRLALSYICVAWFVSLAICLLPTLFVEKKIPVFSEEYNRTILVSPTKYTASNRQCELYKDLNFVLTSSLLSFYIPLIIMIFLYVKVFYAIRQQSIKMKKKLAPTPLINKKHNQPMTTTSGESPLCTQSTIFFDEPSNRTSLFRCCYCCFTSTNRTNEQVSETYLRTHNTSLRNFFHKKQRSDSLSQNSLEMDDQPVHDHHQLGRREITAEARVTRSLAIVIGCFISCWLPFFTLYIIRAVCLCLSFNAIEFFVWLGYSNSSINPVLYAILNKNFRLAFKNIFLSVKKVLFQ